MPASRLGHYVGSLRNRLELQTPSNSTRAPSPHMTRKSSAPAKFAARRSARPGSNSIAMTLRQRDGAGSRCSSRHQRRHGRHARPTGARRSRSGAHGAPLAIVKVPLGHDGDEHIVVQKNRVSACGRHIAASPTHQSATGLDRESHRASPPRMRPPHVGRPPRRRRCFAWHRPAG